MPSLTFSISFDAGSLSDTNCIAFLPVEVSANGFPP